MKRILLYLAFLSLFLTSCTQKWCLSHYEFTSSKDSIYIETVKEIPVYLPGDSVFVEVPVINCPDQELVNIETSKLKQIISILNGKLIASTLVKPDTVFVPVTNTVTVVNEVKVPVAEKYVPKVVRIFAWIGGASLLLFILFIVLKYGKKILPL